MESLTLNVESQTSELCNPSILKMLTELQEKLNQFLEEFKKQSVQDKKPKTTKKVKQDKVYTLEDLHNEFKKKHQISEPITEKQLESYLQYYFDIHTGNMKKFKNEFKTCLHLPDKDAQIIKLAFDGDKQNVIPKKDDIKYFMGLLENKKESVTYKNTTYDLKDPLKLLNVKELFTVSYNVDKLKSKTLYTINEDFYNVLKSNEILSPTLDHSRPCLEQTWVELFNKYSKNPVQLFQMMDVKNLELLKLLNVKDSDYIQLDNIYMRPKVLKEKLSECCDGNNLLPEYLELLDQHPVYSKLTSYNALNNHLKIISSSD